MTSSFIERKQNEMNNGIDIWPNGNILNQNTSYCRLYESHGQ